MADAPASAGNYDGLLDDEQVDSMLEGDDRIVATAKRQFHVEQEREATFRARFITDLKFANADPDNGWQWPGYLWSQRRDDPNGYKPRLTVNKVRINNKQIENDAKQNKPGIHIRPVGGDATVKASHVWEGLVRYIERVSKAEQAYDTATQFQVQGGLGWIRLITEYSDDKSFEQDIRIQRVPNPMNVYLDGNHIELDGSDSNYGFVFEDIPKTVFFGEHPELRGVIADTEAAIGESNISTTWVFKDTIRVVEYFRRSLKKDRLVLLFDPEAKDGSEEQYKLARWSQIPAPIKKLIKKEHIVREREVLDTTIEWYKIAGSVIVERGTFPGRYIPLVPVIGEEYVIEGQLDRKGHTRNLKDAQRMYNFWTSSAVEQVALQTKTKWFIPVGGTENLETYYSTLNQQNYPFIPYHATDQQGNPLPPPSPIEPPTMADAFVKGMVVAQNELAMASGQREENFGQPTNAISGKAIDARVRQGDNSTYHFVDGLAVAIRQVGNIILDVAPHIYETRQLRRIMAEDGTESVVTIDPEATTAYQENRPDKDAPVEVVFNPTIGRYWVEADVGPSYATRRQEAWNAFVQISAQNQELMKYIGDLMFRNADFPGALDIAERLKRIVPPEVLGEGPEPALVAAQKQLEELKSVVADLMEKLASKELEVQNKDRENTTREYEAETKRLKEAGNAESDLPEAVIEKVVLQLLEKMGIKGGQAAVASGAEEQGEPAGPEASEGLETPTSSPEDASAGPEGPGIAAPGPEATEEPPVEGARLAQDGNHYIEDPEHPGQYMRVDVG